MKPIKLLATSLGVLSLGGLALMTLALMDIGQGIETDLNLEWNVVRLALVTTVVFHGVVLWFLWKKPD